MMGTQNKHRDTFFSIYLATKSIFTKFVKIKPHRNFSQYTLFGLYKMLQYIGDGSNTNRYNYQSIMADAQQTF